LTVLLTVCPRKGVGDRIGWNVLLLAPLTVVVDALTRPCFSASREMVKEVGHDVTARD
jgi:hypothetical protein